MNNDNYYVSKNFKISKMTLNDLSLIYNTLNTNFDNFWNSNTLKDELLSKTSHYICIKNSDNIIIGFCGIKINFDTADLMNIVIRKDFRHLGIGSFLLQHIIDFCKNINNNPITNNISSIFLEVNENNTNAIKLYEKYNFNKISIRKNYYNTENAIIMKLNLNEENNTKI